MGPNLEEHRGEAITYVVTYVVAFALILVRFDVSTDIRSLFLVANGTIFLSAALLFITYPMYLLISLPIRKPYLSVAEFVGHVLESLFIGISMVAFSICVGLVGYLTFRYVNHPALSVIFGGMMMFAGGAGVIVYSYGILLRIFAGPEF